MERETQDRSVFLKIYTMGTWITVSVKVKWQEQNKFRPWETFSKPVLTKSSLLASCPSSLLLFSWSPHPIPPLMLPYYLFHFPFLGRSICLAPSTSWRFTSACNFCRMGSKSLQVETHTQLKTHYTNGLFFFILYGVGFLLFLYIMQVLGLFLFITEL